MKRLLLPLLAALALPNAVNANIFNKNLTVKTNVGEKYIVKDSTVRSFEYTKSDLIKRAEESMVEYKAMNDKCYIDNAGIKSMLKVCKKLDNNYIHNLRLYHTILLKIKRLPQFIRC